MAKKKDPLAPLSKTPTPSQYLKQNKGVPGPAKPGKKQAPGGVRG